MTDALDRLYEDAAKDLWLVVSGALSPSTFLDQLSANVQKVRVGADGDPPTPDPLDGEAVALVLDIAMSGPPVFWHSYGETCVACDTFQEGGFVNRPETAHPSNCWWRRAVEWGHELASPVTQRNED